MQTRHLLTGHRSCLLTSQSCIQTLKCPGKFLIGALGRGACVAQLHTGPVKSPGGNGNSPLLVAARTLLLPLRVLTLALTCVDFMVWCCEWIQGQRLNCLASVLEFFCLFFCIHWLVTLGQFISIERVIKLNQPLFSQSLRLSLRINLTKDVFDKTTDFHWYLGAFLGKGRPKEVKKSDANIVASTRNNDCRD